MRCGSTASASTLGGTGMPLRLTLPSAGSGAASIAGVMAGDAAASGWG
jgi:hypothetical protein